MTSNLPPHPLDWEERASFAAQFVRPGLAVLDVGCGRQAVERIFKPRLYLPVDRVAREPRTWVVDLNRTPLPTELLERAELVVMLGLLEYLEHPFALLEQVARAGRPALVTYKAADLARQGEREAGRPGAWRTELSVAAFEEGARAAGFAIAWRFVFDGDQLVMLLVPPSVDPAKVSTVEPLWGSKRPKPDPRARRKLVIGGFLGRGNCGDEAMFQVAYETFSDAFDIVASVDEHGAYPGFWNWYPYNRCRIVHQTALGERHFPLAGFLVCGGGLGPGFGANHALVTRYQHAPSALVGVDMHQPRLDAVRVNARHARLFDYAAVRHAVSWRQRLLGGLFVAHGADWALGLKKDEAADVQPEPEAVAVVVREWALTNIPYDYLSAVTRLVEGLRALGRQPFFLPFAPEDERFLGQTGLHTLAPMRAAWWNPRRVKQMIGAVGVVVSIGRLHPLVFAASTRTPVISLVPPFPKAPQFVLKVDRMSRELGVARAAAVDEVLAAFAAGRIAPSDEGKLRAAEARFDRMVGRLRSLFRAEEALAKTVAAPAAPPLTSAPPAPSPEPSVALPRVVVVNGFHRTGSTIAFYAVQAVLEAGGQKFQSAGASFQHVDRLIAQHLASGTGWLTIKSHRWMPVEADPRVTVFHTTRNLADMGRSFIGHRRRRARFGDGTNDDWALGDLAASEITWQALFERYCADRFPMHTIRYEDYYGDGAALARFIAGRLGIALDEATIERVAARLSADAVKARTDGQAEDVDPVTQFRRMHMSDEKGRPDGTSQGLPPQIVDLLKHL
ncbi:MAG TPA: hypothetical protein VMI56_19770 [Reyranella sp.]|nr:hypothetical protein [Reyranella sp.]